jgi:UrcA family protein
MEGYAMTDRSIERSTMLAGLVGCLLLGAEAGAQKVRVGDPIFELVVVAPRLVRREVDRTNAGSPVELVSLTRRVSYADLDLKMHANVLELEKRIENVAKEACEQLAVVFPLSESTTADCVDDAVDGAREQARAAIEAATGR